MEKLKRMQEYAEAQVCRRRILLNYFGETSDNGCCNCDVCHTPPQTLDGTTVVQKALSAIMRTEETIGFGVTIDILRGNMSAEVVAHGYQQLKTFGSGRDIPYRDWNDYLLQMLQMGFIEIAYNEERHIHITPLGKEVLYGKRAVQLAVINREKFSVKAQRKKMNEEQSKLQTKEKNNENHALFNRLREIRKQIAEESNWPAYIVMSDRSLHALATQQPVTLNEFGNIFGIGEHKRDTYGQQFIDAIKTFKEENAGQEQTCPCTTEKHSADTANTEKSEEDARIWLGEHEAELENLLQAKANIEEQIQALRLQIQQQMEQHGVSNMKSEKYDITYSPAKTTMQFDSKAFKEENEGLYNAYCKPKQREASIVIRKCAKEENTQV